MFSELLCSNGGIIRVSEGAGHTLEETIPVIIYAATLTANSLEAAVAELKRKMPDAAIPSAVRGIKPNNSWGYSFFTIDLLWEPKLTFDIVSIAGLNKDYIILIEDVVTRLREKGIKIGVMFLDREFFNLPSILALSSLGIDFFMAASANKRIKRMLEEHKRRKGVTPAIFRYQ